MTAAMSSKQILLGCPLFDVDWYRQAYQDVDLLGMDAVNHFLRYGRLLQRSPGPVFDTAFYLNTYTDAAVSPENPLLFHLKTQAGAHRPVNRGQLRALVTAEQVRAEADWLSEELDGPRPLLSYCLAAHELTEQFKLGLQFSLADNDSLRQSVEFIVTDLSDDARLQAWAEAEFGNDLRDGYLRLARDGSHDGNPRKAQNAFRGLLRGQIYCNMNVGDLISANDTRTVMDVARRFPDGFVLHDPQDAWQAHVSMPSWIYRNTGYDTRLLPQHQDQMDLVMAALCRYPHLPFLFNRMESAFTQPSFYQDFVQAQGLPNRRFICARETEGLPAQPGALQEADPLEDVRQFNAAFTVMQHLSDATVKQEILHRLNRHKHRIMEALPETRVLGTLFEGAAAEGLRRAGQDDICLFICVRDDEDFLRHLVPHYRALGVTRFFIVDDHSRIPVRSLDLGPDVAVFCPKAGDFRTSKTFWLEGLMKVFVQDEAWVLTVDADEFLQIPSPFGTLSDVTKALATQGQDFAPGLLVDMLPSPDAAHLDLHDPAASLTLFSHFLCDPSAPEASYLDDHTVSWGFGPFAALSWRFDVRHRLFGSIDSLRKLPLFRYRPERHPNQGFHTFDHLDPDRMPGPEIWECYPVLPIFHYKLAKLFNDTARNAMRVRAPAYHSQTAVNILHAVEQPSSFLMTKIEALRPHLLPKDKVQVVTEAFRSKAAAGG